MGQKVELVSVYYAGAAANKFLPQSYLIKEPEANGYGRALVIQGPRTSLVFDPFNFMGWNIANHAGELNVLDENKKQVPAPRLPLDVEFWKEFLLKKWKHFSSLGMQKDWSRASIVMKALGAEVPKVMTQDVADALQAEGVDMSDIIVQKPKKVRSAGKQVIPEKFKPLKRLSKRGSVCEFFLNDVPQPIVECMTKLSMSRSNVLSHLCCANRDQGWGYELTGDCVKVVIPDGATPWEEAFDVLD